MELPERDVVLGVVVADGQPVAVGLDVEEDAGAAVGVAGDRLELHADGAVREVVDALQHGDRVVGELLRVVHQLFVRGAVEPARALHEQLRRVVLAGLPGAAVDHDRPCRRRPARRPRCRPSARRSSAACRPFPCSRSTLTSAALRGDAAPAATAATRTMRHALDVISSLSLGVKIAARRRRAPARRRRRPSRRPRAARPADGRGTTSSSSSAAAYAGQVVDRLQHAFRRRDAARRLAAAELVEDLAVVRARLLEEADRGRRDVVAPAVAASTRRSFDSAWRSRSKRRGSSGARCTSMRSGRADARAAPPRPRAGRSCTRLSDRSQLARDERGGDDRERGGDRREASDSIDAPAHRHAGAHPDRGQAPGPRRSATSAASTTSSRTSPCWNAATIDGRRVAGEPLPDAAVHRGDEAEDPGPDGEAEGQDGGGGRMLGQRGHRRGERDREPGVEQVARGHGQRARARTMLPP